MKTENSVQLIGYVGNDPALKKAYNGSPFTRLSIATDYFRRAKDGTVIKKTTWHDIIAWDHLAETILNNFSKGSHILVRGENRQRTYTDKLGIHRRVTEVRANYTLNLDR